MAAEKQYRTIVGIVQFPPSEGEAGGKPVRKITVRNAGFKENSARVSATLWPSHSHVEVNEGDVVVMEGTFDRRETTGDDGAKRVFNNLSVSRILVLGASDAGERTAVENAVSDDADDDDIPF